MPPDSTTPSALRQLIFELAANDTGLADRTEAALLEATKKYFSSQPYIDAAGHRSRPGIAEDRAAVRKVRQKASELQDAIASMSVHARHAVAAAMNAPLGTLTIGLEALSNAAPQAVSQLQAEKDKAGDHHLNVWAYDVAVVLRDVLQIKPSATRDDGSTRRVRGGAAYARVLRETHMLISSRSLDTARLIDKGLKLLKNPRGDHK